MGAWSPKAFLPIAGLGHCFFDDPVPDGKDEMRPFRDVEELRRRKHASGGVLPTQQGFHGNDSTGVHAVHGLVVEFQLLLFQAALQFDNQRRLAQQRHSTQGELLHTGG